MGDTLHKVAIEVIDSDGNNQIWDKAQAVVMLSHTKIGKNTIFVRDTEILILDLRKDGGSVIVQFSLKPQ